MIERAEHIALDEEQRRFLLDLLDDPPRPNEKLRAAAMLLATRKTGK